MSESLQQTLLGLERRFWAYPAHRLAELYESALADEAVLVLPAPAGVLDKDACIRMFTEAPGAWQAYEIEDDRLLPLGEDAALLTYRAFATREGGLRPYRALISSAYLRRGDAWLLAFHQQTPLTDEPEEPAP